jgi:hypothetical protein
VTFPFLLLLSAFIGLLVNTLLLWRCHRVLEREAVALYGALDVLADHGGDPERQVALEVLHRLRMTHDDLAIHLSCRTSGAARTRWEQMLSASDLVRLPRQTLRTIVDFFAQTAEVPSDLLPPLHLPEDTEPEAEEAWNALWHAAGYEHDPGGEATEARQHTQGQCLEDCLHCYEEHRRQPRPLEAVGGVCLLLPLAEPRT